MYSMCTQFRAKHLNAFLVSLQVLESMQLKQEVTQIEEERIQVLNNIEELEQKIKDLDNQMEESVREVERSAAYKHKRTPEQLDGVCSYLVSDTLMTSW